MLLLLLMLLQLLLLVLMLLLLLCILITHTFVRVAGPGQDVVGVATRRRDLGETSTSIRGRALRCGVRSCANVKRRLDLKNTAGKRMPR